MPRFAEKIAAWLVKANVIQSQEQALFAYAVSSLLFGMAPVFIVAMWGLAFGMLAESLIMIAPFIAIRKYSGGFHLKSLRQCIAATTFLLGTALLTVYILLQHETYIGLTVAVLIGSCSIFFCSPIDSEARHLTATERCAFRKIARYVLLGMLLLYSVFFILHYVRVFVPMGIGILLVSLLQVPHIIKAMTQKTTIPTLNVDKD